MRNGECGMRNSVFPEQVCLIHAIHKSMIGQSLRVGLRTVSEYDDLNLDMRCGVVYCWLRKEDDKMSGGGQRADFVYLEVTVERERCVVADMEWSSLALMYKQGQGRPQNMEASRFLAELYRVTAMPLSEYVEGAFWTPEVLVKGDIPPESVRLAESE